MRLSRVAVRPSPASADHSSIRQQHQSTLAVSLRLRVRLLDVFGSCLRSNGNAVPSVAKQEQTRFGPPLRIAPDHKEQLGQQRLFMFLDSEISVIQP